MIQEMRKEKEKEKLNKMFINRKKIKFLGKFFSVLKKKKKRKKREQSFQDLNAFFSNYELKTRKSFGKRMLRHLFWMKLFNFIFFPFKIIQWNILKKIILKGGYSFLVIILIIFVVYALGPGVLSAPKSVIVTTQQEWESGTAVNISTTSSSDAIQLLADGNWTARTWAPSPDTLSFGSTSVLVGNYLYVTRGYGDKSFYRYNTLKNKWDTLTDLPQPAHAGCDAVYDNNGNIYFIFGGYSKKFYKYNIESATWTELPDLLDTIYYGASIEFDGTNLYIARGQATTDFWKFNIAENSWYNLAPAPYTLYRGSNMVYGQDGYMYVTRGYNRNTFFRYDIANNTWDSLANAPITFYGATKGTYYNGYIYYLRSNNSNIFYRYSISGNSWESLENAPANVNYTSLNYNSNDGMMYVLQGNGQYRLWKFNPTAGTNGQWVGPKNLPGTVNTGGDLIWNGVSGAGGYLYAIRGGNNFYRYDISNNDWSTLANPPANLSYGTKGTYHDGYIYIPRGNGNTFYRYDTNTDTWTTLADAPGSLRYGSCAAYNSGDGYIYMTRGNGTNDFYRYDITSDSWTTLSDIISSAGVNYRVYVGGRLISDGNDLYLMPGDGETAFLKYDISIGTWEELARTPFAQYYGTDMDYYNGKIYALAGYYKDETWEYNIANNVWRKLPSNQKYTYGRGPYNGASLVYAGNNSFYATPGMGLSDMWSYSLGTNNYLNSGTYTSNILDLSYVSSWISLTYNGDEPANTSISVETRTSADGENWSNWIALSGSNIQSPTNRYIQVRFTLNSTDGVYTPTVYDFTVAYNSEDNPPNNPSSVNAYSQRINGDPLTSGIAYKYAHPYFSWTGASDNESGIAGYYVYFGTDSNADPETEGVYQVASDYVVNLAMQTGNYYLRIKTKDKDGNITSSTFDAFTYNYNGVSPFLTETKTTQEDFSNGTLENVESLSSDKMRLSSISGAGFWNENRLSYAPGGIRYGGELAYAESEGKLYTLRGNNTTNFYSYDIASDTWETLANTPASVRMGGAVVEGPDGYLYATRGNNTSDFWRYDIANNTWSVMASAPKNFYYGGSLSYDGNRYIYAFPGNDDAFYRYDTQNNIWTTLTNAEFGNPNEGDGQRVYVGSDSVYDGSNNIYVMQGNYYPYFAKYSINDNSEAGESADTWTPLAKAPAGIYAGGSLAYDEESNAIYMLSGNWRQNFFKYDIDSNVWTELPKAPVYVEYGASLKVVNGYIYMIRGAGSTSFYRFNIEENSWETPQRGFFGPSNIGGGSYFTFYYGTDIARDDNGNIYMIRGARDNTFGRYNIKTGEFIKLAKIPVGVYNGANLLYVSDENAIYLVAGDMRTRRNNGENNYFMKYDIDNNSWEIITQDRVPNQVYYGSSMTYDGSRYIYLTRGGNGNYWWRYDTQASAGSRWSSRLPTTSGWTQGYGARILYKDNYIYSIRGQNTNTFWRYDINAGTWSQLSNVPGNVYIGGSLEDGQDGYLYVTRGYNSSDFFRYNIATDSWETIENVPGQIYYGGSSTYSSSRIWATTGGGSNSYRDGLYSYVISSASNGTGFQKTGTYISEPIDLTAVYKWANLTINYTTPDNTNLVISTRSSEDGNSWSAWDQVSNKKELGSNQYRYSIVSPVNRYIQVKIDYVSSDKIYSPSVEEYSINYYQDIQAPDNPTNISAYSASDKSTAINTGTWYNYNSPYFEWPLAETPGGASDGSGGSGVVGYWVYFGTDSSADPFVDGIYQTTNSYTASNLNSDQTYYLKIKAIDDAGMIPANSYDAFTYRFDNTPPTNPSDISVTPAGYTASDSYTFLWESDASDASSGIAKFQYRTGGDTSGTWFDIDNTSVVTISIPNADHADGAYQSGKNWFYLRAVDNAGNVSNPLAQEYYYSASAPSPPQNLSVSPVYSTDNLFAFQWDQPATFIGDGTKLKYYYSVNALPNAYNTIETTLTSAGPGPFATQKGSNRFYVVAMDEAGNIDYDLYSYVDFTADTTAPAAPQNVQIFDTSDRENKEYSVAIKWSPPAGADNDNFDGYVIYRSLTENGSYTKVATTSGTAYVDTNLESKRYYYYVKSKDNTNNLSIASTKVTIIPTGRYTKPPNLTQDPKVSEQSFAATFTWGTNRVASSFVEYGKSIKLGKTNGQVDSVTDHKVVVTGLEAGTKYYYRVKYIDPDGNIGTSEIKNFTTLPPPTVSDFTVTDIKLDNAYVSWKTNTSAICTLKYGAGSYSNSIEETASASNHIEKVTGLTAETNYQVQVECIDQDNNSFTSDQYSFSTPVKPVASNIKVENKENVDLPTVIIEYKTNVPTTTLIYFKTNEESSSHTYLKEEKVTEHKAEIEGLNPAKEYTLNITGTDENGISIKKVEQKITTKSDSRPPEITTNRAIGKVIGRGNSSQANIYVKIETNEPTTVKINYAKGVTTSGFEQSTGEDPLNTYHLITIPAEIGQIYSYQVKATDEAGNVTNTKAATVVVGRAKRSALEIIGTTAEEKFGWLLEIWK